MAKKVDTARKANVVKYYDQEAKDYVAMYRKGYKRYPMNLIRINLIIERLKKRKVKTILDIGSGTCGPMIKLLDAGFDVRGFDFSKDMVEQGKIELANAGYSPDLVTYADIENFNSQLPEGKFDAMLALGVFPHIPEQHDVLNRMKSKLNKNGVVYIEFRNDLFAAFTMNRYSLDFFLNRVLDLKSMPKKLRDEMVTFYTKRLKVDAPKRIKGRISYTDILADFHNPLTIPKELFEACKFKVDDVFFYHYHALPPIFEQKYPDLYRKLSMKLEKPNDWRGYIMASAFVVEATKNN